MAVVNTNSHKVLYKFYFKDLCIYYFRERETEHEQEGQSKTDSQANFALSTEPDLDMIPRC